MSVCPHCSASLPAELTSGQACPHCGQPIGAVSLETEATFVSEDFLQVDHDLLVTSDFQLPPSSDPTTSVEPSDSLPPTMDAVEQAGDLATQDVTIDKSQEIRPEQTVTIDISGDSQEFDQPGHTIAEDPERQRSEALVEGTVDLADESAGIAFSEVNPTIVSEEIEPDRTNDEPFSEFIQTIASGIDIGAEEIRTIASNFGAPADDENPLMTIKSRHQDSTSRSVTEGSPGDTVPIRTLGNAEDDFETHHAPEYKLLKILGEGGMGVVWSARQTSVDRDVAVKMIKGPLASKAVQRQKFLAEAIVTGDLDHPNIVPIYDVGRDSAGTLFYSMKKVQGIAWSKVIKQKSQAENIEILLRVGDAMAFSHARGIIHRDLKPENIMLGEFGEVLVMDWGLALIQGNPEKAGKIRQSSTMGGTPAYMAPEMAAGPIHKISPASDVYLLGAILWEIITGRPPHPGKTVQECLLAAIRNTITPTSKAGELIDIARKAMQKESRDRYQSVRDFQQAVRSYLSHSESLAMAARAEQDLARAKSSNDYNDFSKAIFGFEEAVVLWPGNRDAANGIQTSRLAYAQNAFSKGDHDLASSQLDPARPEHAELRQQVLTSQTERETRQRRLRLARQAMVGLVASILIIVSVAFFWIRGERNEAIRQKGLAVKANEDLTVSLQQTEDARKAEASQRLIAEENADLAQKNELEAKKQQGIAEQNAAEAIKQEKLARKNAEEARANAAEADRQRLTAQMQEKLAIANAGEAERQRKLAVVQEKLAKDNETKAVQQQMIAEKNAQEAQKQQQLAEMNAVEAKRQQKLAEKSADEAQQARVAEQYEAYIARIGLAAAKIEENAFDVAEELLQESPVVLRNWEWGRLQHLCSQSATNVPVNAPVEALALSPDGGKFVMTSWDHTARIVDSVTGEVLQELPHEGLYVHAAAWSGNIIVTASNDPEHSIRLWDAESAVELSQLKGHTDAVVSLTFSPNGRWLLSTSYDNTARLWDLADPVQPAEVALLEGHTWWVWRGAFSPEFDPYNAAAVSQIATVSQDGKAIVWQIDVGTESTTNQVDVAPSPRVVAEELATFAEHKGPVYAVDISASGLVATGGYDQRILLWRPQDVPPVSLEDLLDRRPQKMEFSELTGHSGPVQSVAFGREGDVLVSGSRDNSVKVWNIEQQKAFKTFRGHSGEVRSVALTPDGRQVISGGKDGQAILWSVDNYAEIRELQGRQLVGHADAVLCARYSVDGSQIVTAGRDRIAFTWDAATGKPLHEFQEGHEYLASTALQVPDGQSLITAAGDSTVRIWNVATGAQQHVLTGTGQAAVLALSDDGQWLLTGHEPDGLRLYRVSDLLKAETSESIVFEPIGGHHGAVTCATFLPGSSERFVSCDGNGRCVLHVIGRPDPVWDVKHHASSIVAVAITPDGQQILTASADYTVGIVDAASGVELGTLKVGRPVMNLSLSPDGKQAVTVSSIPDAIEPNSCRLRLWDVAKRESIRHEDVTSFAVVGTDFSKSTGELLLTCSDNTVRLAQMCTDRFSMSEPLLDFQKLRSLVWNARFTPTGKSLITVGGNEARLWDGVTLREQMRFSPHGAVAAAAFSPNGKLLVTGSWDNSAKIWDAQTGQPLRKLHGGHTAFINSVQFSPDNQMVLTASDDGLALLWDVTTGSIVRKFEGHNDRIRSATFSPDGSLVLTTSNDKTAIVWDAATGQKRLTLSGHDWAVLCGVFSRDGQQVITGSEDNTARLWNAATGEEVAKFEGHTAPVTGVDFSLDGLRVFTASRDTTAKLWDASPSHVGKEILTLAEHSQELTALQVAADGKSVLTASRDGRAILWPTTAWQNE